ncbi:MAG: FCD domain-containing protein [Eubacteriales bacterium]|jgi:DNA-binding FadR family transcriptional regulator|nr:FCD domain-containing protein [Eubacteriales bacterium]
MKQEGLKKSFVHAMQQKIFSGEYQVGQQLPPERELAQELGVSRSLVNTGILELASQGFIRIIPRQGSIIADYKKNGTLQVLSALMSCDSFRLDYPLLCNLVDLRVLIECESARLASLHASAEEIETLRVLAQCIKNAAHPLDAVEPMVRFHYLIILYSGNAVYSMTFKSFENTISRLIRQHLTLAPDIPKSAKLHESIVQALQAHDAESSAQNVRLCILHGMNALKKLYHES